jgi:YfiH family protein
MKTTTLSSPSISTYTTGRGETIASLTAELVHHSPHLIEMQQVHSNAIAILEDNKNFSTAHSTRIPNVDGVITTLPNLLLVVRTADCVPILFAHPGGVIGALHAGRQGTQQQIFLQALQLLKHRWQIERDLQVWIGPHICSTCYEVDRATGETYDLLSEILRQLRSEFSTEAATVAIDDRCTAHNLDQLHSYRKEGAGVLMNYSGILRSL